MRPGHVGLASRAGQPVLLEPGVHISNDPLWLWRRQVANDCPHASEGALHVCFVPAGSLAPVIVDGRGRLLPPGQHRIVARTGFEYLGTKPATDEHIRAGTLHRVQVPAGSVGLATEGGAARLIGAGEAVYVDCPSFRYLGCRSLAEPLIVHDSIKLVTVNEGFAGISYDEGRLVVLDPGRHVLSKPSHHVGGLVSLGQHTLPIAEVTSMSSDNVGLVFDAAITVQVVDVRRAVTAFAGAGRGDRMGPSGSGGGGGGGYCSRARAAARAAASSRSTCTPPSPTRRSSAPDHHRQQPVQRLLPRDDGDADARRRRGRERRRRGLAKPPPPPTRSPLARGGDRAASSAPARPLHAGVRARDERRVRRARIRRGRAPHEQGPRGRDVVRGGRGDRVAARADAARIRGPSARGAVADVIEAEGRARATDILAGAEAARVATLDAAMAAACSTSQQRRQPPRPRAEAGGRAAGASPPTRGGRGSAAPTRSAASARRSASPRRARRRREQRAAGDPASTFKDGANRSPPRIRH